MGLGFFGTAVQPKRPSCACLVALPGLLNPDRPQCFTIIDLADWPHWALWQWVLVGIDPDQEPGLRVWEANHPDG